MHQPTDSNAHTLRDWLQSTRKAVVFTGAGISTESGIPDFRSPNGIWSKTTPIQYDEFVRFEESRREAWRRKFIVDEDIARAEPNAGHRAVASLVERGVVQCVITQNIDGLHQRSGVPEDRLVELHGNTTYATCLTCNKRHELAPIREAFLGEDKLPVCDDCGGLVKTATISFGQSMPEAAMRIAEQATLDCDLLLAIGSSLVVYPAAGFPILAKRSGARLVIINRESTELDSMADLVLNTEIGDTMRTATGAN